MTNAVSADLKNISYSLQDDISRSVFSNLYMYSVTKEKGYLRNIIATTPEGEALLKKLKELKSCEKIIFGAGQWGRWIYEYFPNENWQAFTDNEIKENEIDGLRVISVQELVHEYKDKCVFISSRYHWQEIRDQLLAMGWKNDKIFPMGSLIDRCARRIYFDGSFLKHQLNEVFVDAGAYDGRTMLDFVAWCKGKYEAIYAFEPQKEVLHKCRRNCSELKNISYFSQGLWDQEAILRFVSSGTESHIVESETNTYSISVTSIDKSVLGGAVPTFIKMDIEGSEIKAIEGAAECISKYEPQLAISVYHKPDDIIKIPLLIKKLNKKYRFWLRHYSLSWFDTVLYAVP